MSRACWFLAGVFVGGPLLFVAVVLALVALGRLMDAIEGERDG